MPTFLTFLAGFIFYPIAFLILAELVERYFPDPPRDSDH